MHLKFYLNCCNFISNLNLVTFTFNLQKISFLISVAYLNLGTSLIALGRCHEAASALRDGTKLDGTGLRDRTAHENARISSLLQLGGLYADQGKLQRALAVYREALHTIPRNYPPQVSGMFFSFKFRNLQRAVNDYPDALCCGASHTIVCKRAGEMCNSKLISNLFPSRFLFRTKSRG